MNIGNRAFRIYVYPGDHPPPHCHVRWNDKSETLVLLPTMKVLAGQKLTKEAKDMITEHLDELIDEFENLNPKKH